MSPRRNNSNITSLSSADPRGHCPGAALLKGGAFFLMYTNFLSKDSLNKQGRLRSEHEIVGRFAGSGRGIGSYGPGAAGVTGLGGGKQLVILSLFHRIYRWKQPRGVL